MFHSYPIHKYPKIGYYLLGIMTIMKTIQDTSQLYLFATDVHKTRDAKPFNTSFLKWIGSKQRVAHQIISYFPVEFDRYYEPFLGSGGVLGTLIPKYAVASDTFASLIQIWQTLKNSPETVKEWYRARWEQMSKGSKVEVYEQIKASYNKNPNGADLLFLCRSCYGGVVRFRKADGYMSTPCGVHKPIPPAAFSARVDEWRKRTSQTEFSVTDYADALRTAKEGDLVYCDPPYRETQSILYGAQEFDLGRLLDVLADCKARGVHIALSIDGTKRSGDRICNVPIPAGLFEREEFVNCGRSMLRRFQMEGQTLESEVVADRLLLTY